MGILKNYRHERFVLGIYKGMCQKDAAIFAGYMPTRARQTGHELVTYSDIKKRLEELGAVVETVTVMDQTEVKERLTEIGRARLIDFVDKDCNITLEAENNGALAEVVVTEYTIGKGDVALSKQATKIKLHNPITAMAELSKLRGDYAPAKVSIEPDGVLGELLTGLLGRLRGYNPPELPEGNGDKNKEVKG